MTNTTHIILLIIQIILLGYSTFSMVNMIKIKKQVNGLLKEIDNEISTFDKKYNK